MAVGSSTAPDAASVHRPVRTCVGCRQRAAAAELLRVVVAPQPPGVRPGAEGNRGSDRVSVVPDPQRRAPGRGAWLHYDLECVERAERRRAFGRALRAPGPADAGAVRAYLTELPGTPASGTPQE